MKSMNSLLRSALAVIALAGSALADPSVIVTTGNWNATSTWNTAAVPADASGPGIGNNSTVTFQSGDSYTGGGWTQGLLIGYDGWGVNWGLSNPGNGTLNVTGGNLTTGYLGIGAGLADNPNVTGTLNISGGTVTADNTMLLGWSGAGGSSINVSGGSFTLSAGADTANIGHGGSATFTVSGGTATFNRVFGFVNNSTLTISGNGVMNANVDHIYTSGTVNVNGGTLNDVGYFTGANLNVAGGTININRAGGSHLGLSSTQTTTVSSGQLNSSDDLYLGLAGNGTVNQSGGTFSVAAGKIFWLGANLGAGTYNQTGGTLEVGAMTNGGGTATYTLSGGTLKALGDLNYAVAGITTSITGTAGSGATIDSNGNTVTFNASQINLGTGGSLTKAGAGTLAVNNDAGFSTGTWNVNAGTVNMVGYFNGAAVNVAGGSLNINRAGGSHFALGTTSTTTLSSGAINNTGDLYLGFSPGGNGTLNQSGGTLTVTGNLTIGGLGGVGTWNITGGTQSITGALAVSANSTININSGGTLTKTPTIASGGVVNINAGGALTTTTDVTIGAGGTLKFNGGTATIGSGVGFILNEGTLDINGQTVAAGSYEASPFWAANAKLLNSSATAATIVGTGNKNTVWINAAGAVIETVGDLTIGSIVTDGGSGNGFTKTGAGTLVLTNADNVYAGETRLAAGGLSIGNATALQNSTLNLAAADAGTVTAIGQNSTLGGLSGSRNLDMLTRTLSIGNNNASTTYSGVLSNGALTKIGTGALTLSGANTYSGATTVSAGQLFLLGSSNANATGNLSVAAGAWLGGTGAIGGATSVSGSHSPGNADAEPGLQTLTNGLSYAAGSTFVWELVANSADSAFRGNLFDAVNLTTAGALAIDPAATLSLVFNSQFGSQVNWTNSFWGSDRQWTIFDNASPVTWNGTFFGTVLVGNDSTGAALATARPNASFSIANSGGDLVLNYQAVPEPGTWGLLGAGLAALAALGRRQTPPATGTT